eukprot:CAMPEP_0117606430 /NCGR_PEP_ID=MMETSP0784-20121206/79709_1 /TAXON_ID=39447 /ORGANISM="" /LENGTH=230 /DNA_ID=CAMNT_0005409513 /DNA_START=89 /DNA_END=780 /DNA_ORIENTATION=+
MLGFFHWSTIDCRPCLVHDPANDVIKVDMGFLHLGKEEHDIGPVIDYPSVGEFTQEPTSSDDFVRSDDDEEEDVARQEAAWQAAEQLLAEATGGEAEEAGGRGAAPLGRGAGGDPSGGKDSDDTDILNSFLKRNSYKGVNEKRRTATKTKYALHTAVKQKNVDAVRVLLEARADPSVTDSNNLTPLQLASILNVTALARVSTAACDAPPCDVPERRFDGVSASVVDESSD